jgi:DNA-directed RNA polymerase subunit omega
MINTVTLDELMKKVDSRYTLVVMAAKRARKITENKDDEINGIAVRKPVTEALKEIASGRITFRRTKQGIK